MIPAHIFDHDKKENLYLIEMAFLAGLRGLGGLREYAPHHIHDFRRRAGKDLYDAHGAQIEELKHYFNSIVPAGKQVQIEFENPGRLAMLKISPTDTSQRSPGDSFVGWQLRLDSRKVDSLLPTLGWTRDTLTSIRTKLNAASCVRITNGEPGVIGFKRFGAGMFYYTVFEHPIPDSLQPKYNNGCNAILYNNRVVLGFTGDPIGKKCFPEY